MARPTFLQSFLNRPSQSYTSSSSSYTSHTLRRRDYHIVKHSFVAAASSNVAPQLPAANAPADEDSSDDEDDDDDVFFTPNTSPRVSVNGEEMSMFPPHGSFSNAVPTDVINMSFSRPTVPTSNSFATTASASSTSLTSTTAFSDETHFSWPSSLSETTTRATTPIGSDSGKPCDSGRSSPSTSRHSRSSGGSRRGRTAAPPPAEDWAKDVRWLVAPKNAPKTSSAPSSRPAKHGRSATEGVMTTEGLLAGPQHPLPRRAKSTGAGSRSKSHRAHSQERMSALWEEDEGDEQDHHSGHPTAVFQTLPARSRTISAPQTSPRHRATSVRSGSSHVTTASATSFTSTTSRTVDLPSPLPVSDGGAPGGYTSLVLPRAAPLPHKRHSAIFSSSSMVDITRSGLAQTTMSTISMTKDAGAATLRRSRRIPSFSRGSSTNGMKSSSAPTPPHLRTTLPSPLSFTSHTSPPNKVNSSQVLVQVWAVGLDGLDDMIVQEKAVRNDSYGFVPGRSFVGRAVECGYEVNAIAKSDWVMGLLDVRKCGALSEFIVVDKQRLTRCPRPSPALTLEQLSLLPLSGIPAHRAVRTSASIERGTRALVLRAHDGAGALAVQELAAFGVHVTAQIPPDIVEDEDGDGDNEEKEVLHDEKAIGVVERVKRWGASEVKVEHSVAAVNLLHESEFDLVIDTVGGRRIWDACRRVLHTTGQFTTLVGDAEQAIPSMNAHFRSNLRSLRRAFVKKDRKTLGYAWVSPDADVDNDGADIRDSLVAVAKMAGDGVLAPYVPPRAHVPFERTPVTFGGGDTGILGLGRTAVVRIVD